MRLLQSEDTRTWKEAIRAYGAVQTSLFMNKRLTSEDNEYYMTETSAYYYPVEHTPTHDVLLIGWDDGFSRDAFKTDPGQDGAWICQNTWGDDFGEGGVFYVSYAQLTAFANIFAHVVLPVPLVPVKRSACPIFPVMIWFLRALTTYLCPITSLNSFGRYFLYKAKCRISNTPFLQKDRPYCHIYRDDLVSQVRTA